MHRTFAMRIIALGLVVVAALLVRSNDGAVATEITGSIPSIASGSAR